MIDSGYYYCPTCFAEPRYVAMSGNWAKGMYYPYEHTTRVPHHPCRYPGCVAR